MSVFDNKFVHEFIKRQDEAYSTGDEQIIKESTPIQKSIVLRELHAICALLEYISDKKISSIKKILEIGCGIGAFTFPLASIFNEVVGVDLSPAGVKMAQKRCFQKNVKLAVMDGIKLDELFENKEKFDLIYARAFHPFYRKFYSSVEGAFVAHKKILERYLTLLNNNGYILISHTDALNHDQNLKIESLDGLRAKICVFLTDFRIFFVLLNLTKNNVGLTLRLTRIINFFLRPFVNGQKIFLIQKL